MENIALLWLVPTLVSIDDLPISKTQLDRIFNSIHIEDDPNNCIDLMTNSNDHYRFLVLVGDQSTIVDNLTGLDNHCFIYLYDCSSPSSTSNKRIRGVFSRSEDLSQQLQNDAQIIEQSQSIFKFKYNCSTDTQFEQDEFLGSKLLLNTLIDMRRSRQNPYQEVFDQCRLLYSNNLEKLSQIDDFSDAYRSTEVIRWYSKELFLYRLINLGLRMNHVRVIYKFRSIIQDIYRQLKPSGESRLYRGQRITWTELYVLKSLVNKHVSLNSFIWTTKDVNAARLSSGDGKDRSHFESVIFEFVIDETVLITEVCDVDQTTLRENVLICMGTIFKVESTWCKDEIHYVRLLIECYDLTPVSRMQMWLSCFNRRDMDLEQVGALKLTWVYHMMTDVDKAEQFYQILNVKTSGKGFVFTLGVFIFSEVAEMCRQFRNAHKIEVNESRCSIVKEAMSIFKSLSPSSTGVEMSDRFEHLLTITRTCQESRPDKVLLILIKWLDLLKFISELSILGKEKLELPKLSMSETQMECLQLIETLLEKESDSMNEEIPIRSMDQMIESNSEPDLFVSSSQRLISMHTKKERWSKVIECCESIISRTDIGNNPEMIVDIHAKCADAHMKLNDREMSEYYLNQANEILTEHHLNNHRLVGSIYFQLGNIAFQRVDYPKAVIYYIKVIEQREVDQAADAYEQLADIALQILNIQRVRSFYRRALEYRQRQQPQDTKLLAMNHISLTRIEHQLGNYGQRNFHLEEATKFSKDHATVTITLLNLIKEICSE